MTDQLATGLPTRPLLIALGNRLRGDDAAGLLVAEELNRRAGQLIDVVVNPADVMAIVNHWRGRALVYIVDACRDSSLPVGDVIHLDNVLQDDIDILATLRQPQSSHVLDIKQAIELGRAIDAVPGAITVFAIAGAQFDLGSSSATVVAEAAERVAGMIENSLLVECSERVLAR